MPMYLGRTSEVLEQSQEQEQRDGGMVGEDFDEHFESPASMFPLLKDQKVGNVQRQ